ncbi:unnamed protein product, partial [Oikopleura dioica]
LAPLYKLTSAKVDYEWSDIHQQAFDTIKAELLKEPTLAHYKPGSKLVLVTDSSGHAVGGTLYQVKEGVFSPLGFFSKSLQGPDLKRSMRIKELFALCWGIQFFEYFLINTEFDCFVDHKSLLFLFREARRSKLDIKLCNVHNYLQAFDFNIIHKNGTSPEMASADFFSRLPKYRSSDLERDCIDFFDVDETIFAAHTLSEDDVIFSFENRSFTSEEMATAQNECQNTRNLIVKSKINTKQSRLKLKDNVLYSKDRLVLPSQLADEFIQYLHTITAHAGSQQLLQMLRKFFISNIQEKYYINNSPKGSLDNLSSNEAVFGRQFHVPFTLKDPVTVNIQPFIKALNEYMKKLHPSLLNFQVQRYQKLLKRDKNDCPVLDLGTVVLCWKPDLLAGKLGINWSGPYKIHRRLSKDSYIVKCPITKKEYRRHISLIRPLRQKLQGDTTEFIKEDEKENAEDQLTYRKIDTRKDYSAHDDEDETSSTKSDIKLTSSPLNQKDRHEPVDEIDYEDIWKNRLRSRKN